MRDLFFRWPRLTILVIAPATACHGVAELSGAAAAVELLLLLRRVGRACCIVALRAGDRKGACVQLLVRGRARIMMSCFQFEFEFHFESEFKFELEL